MIYFSHDHWAATHGLSELLLFCFDDENKKSNCQALFWLLGTLLIQFVIMVEVH